MTGVRQARTGLLRLVTLMAAVAAAVGLSGASAPERESANVLYREDFETGQAEGWNLESGWEVAPAPQSGKALRGRGHAWATYARDAWGDCAVRLRVNLLKGGLHLNYRVSGVKRYLIGFDEQGISLSKTVAEGQHPRLRFVPEPYRLGYWHWILIVGKGNTLAIYVNGQCRITHTDPDPLVYGKIAFETLDDTEAYVDDITVVGEPQRSALRWVRTGGPLGGLGYDVRMRPDRPEVLYVSDAWSGVNTSSDGGRTWQASNTGIVTRAGPSGDAIPIFCLTLDPRHADVMWAGTQNSRGIYKSADAGRTWARKDNGVVERWGITLRGFGVDPADSNTVYAAAEISSVLWAGRDTPGREFDRTRGVVYKTTDGGDHWTPIWRGDNLARYVWIDPRNRNVLYVSTGIFDREAANSDPAQGLPGGVGILKSTDGGRTWRVLGRDQGLLNLYVGSLFMHPKNPDILLAGAGNNAYRDGGGVYRSTDAGETWKRVLSCGGIQSVEFALGDPRIAYAGSPDAIYRSEDGGATWSPVTEGGAWGPPGVRAGFPIDFQVDLRNPDRLFVNNYGGGNFLSEDGGRTWQIASTGYTGAQVRDIAVDPADARRVFAAARSGLFVSPDRGGQWVGLNYPPASCMEWHAVAVDPADSQHVLAANNWQGTLVQSHDGGRTWRSVGERPGPKMSWQAIAFAPSDPKTVYAGTSAFFSSGSFGDHLAAAGIYVSRDGGRTWQPANDANSADANVAALAVDPHRPAVVYAATCRHGLLKSTDGGGRWQPVNQGLRVKDTRAVAIDPTNPQVLYVGLENAGICISTDGGDRWRPCGNGMDPEAAIRDVVLDPKNPRTLYAADIRSGVYRSTDGGGVWMRINDGLRTRAVQALAISSDGGTLYAATEGEGVFRLDLDRSGR